MHRPDPGRKLTLTQPASLPPAVVLNMHETGLGIARSLGRRGVRVIGAGADSRAPGTGTRYAEIRTAPDSLTEPDALVAFLEALGAELGERAVLFPTNDADLAFIDKYRDRLRRHFTLGVPESELLHAITDKARLCAMAREHGLSAPVTRYVASLADLDARATELVYPAVIKPVDTTTWRSAEFRDRVGVRKGWRVPDHAACRAAYARIAEVAPAALIQEWINGPENGYRVVGAAMAADGTALGAFTARKRLQYPPGVGLGCLYEAQPDDALMARTLAFLRAIGFAGVCEAEFKPDTRTGEPRLIEINPRHWDQHALGAALGVDLPWLDYRARIGLPPQAFQGAQGHGVWLRWSGIAGSLKEAVKARDPAVVGPLLRSLGQRRCYAFWASDDRGPVVQALRNRWFRKRNRQA